MAQLSLQLIEVRTQSFMHSSFMNPQQHRLRSDLDFDWTTGTPAGVLGIIVVFHFNQALWHRWTHMHSHSSTTSWFVQIQLYKPKLCSYVHLEGRGSLGNLSKQAILIQSFCDCAVMNVNIMSEKCMSVSLNKKMNAYFPCFFLIVCFAFFKYKINCILSFSFYWDLNLNTKFFLNKISS